jgi:hypothetical protein
VRTETLLFMPLQMVFLFGMKHMSFPLPMVPNVVSVLLYQFISEEILNSNGVLNLENQRSIIGASHIEERERHWTKGVIGGVSMETFLLKMNVNVPHRLRQY